MNPQDTASITALLTPVLGVKTAGAVSLIAAVVAIAGQVMPYLHVADSASPGWYRVLYGLLARATGSRGNNSPMPPSMQPAGGIVPVPPSMKTALAAPSAQTGVPTFQFNSEKKPNA